MRKTASWLAIFALLALPFAALADLYSEGRDLYKQGKYAEAVAKFGAAAKEDPKDARIPWQLNFAYHKLDRDADSLKAVQKAAELDPTHAFASSTAKYQEILADRQKKAGKSSTPASRQVEQRQGGSTSAPIRTDFSTGGVTKRLLDGDVYIEPGIQADGNRLQRVSDSLKPKTVKFALFNNNANASALSREANRIRDYLSIKDGYVIVASRRAVSAASTQLKPDRLRELTKQVAPTMETGRYTEGLETLARGLVQARSRQTAATTNTWLIVIGLIVGVIVIWAVVSGSKKKRAIAARKGPLERAKSDVIKQMNFLDDSLPLVDASWGGRIKEARVAAGHKLDQASALMRNANSVSDLDRAKHLLDQALADCSRGRSFVDQAMSGAPASAPTSSTTGVPPVVNPATGGTGVPNWDAIPNDQKGVCFFCSKPSLVSELTPVTVNLTGQQQKVLACPDDLHTVRTGQMPQIRAFNVDGRYVPWYADDRYDPYRDYYGRGYGGGSLMQDLVMLSLIDHMFWNWHHPIGWGWGGWGHHGGYMFYPGHHYYHDHYGHQAAGGADYSQGPDAGGTDFLGGTGGDFGGTDFGATDIGRGSDFGGTDFGGGFDQS